MSMYQIIYGINPLAGSLVNALGFSVGELHRFGRWRDTYLRKNATTGELEVHVFTRNGGGNRKHWNDETPAGPMCECQACAMQYRIPTFKGYLRDFDDSFDSTYATIVFELPEHIRSLMVELIEQRPDLLVDEFVVRHQRAMAQMKPGDPAFERLREQLAPLISELEKKA